MSENTNTAPEQIDHLAGLDKYVQWAVEESFKHRPGGAKPGRDRPRIVLDFLLDTAAEYGRRHGLTLSDEQRSMIRRYFEAKYPPLYAEEDQQADAELEARQKERDARMAAWEEERKKDKADPLWRLCPAARAAVEAAFEEHLNAAEPGWGRDDDVTSSLADLAAEASKQNGVPFKIDERLAIQKYVTANYPQRCRDEDRQADLEAERLAEQQKAEKERQAAEEAKRQAEESRRKNEEAQRAAEEARRQNLAGLRQYILDAIADTPPGEDRWSEVRESCRDHARGLRIYDSDFDPLFADCYTLERHREDRQAEALDALGLEPAVTVTPEDDSDPADWLVPGLVVEYQLLVIGGPAKCLKTSIALDLAVSAATGTPFLGHFPAGPALKGVIVFTAESGEKAVGNTVRRICAARGVPVPQNLVVFHKAPDLTVKKMVTHLGHLVRKYNAGLVILDPLYLALGLSADVKPESMFSMGPVLRRFVDACTETWATPVIVHHASQGLRPGRRMLLQNLSHAGLGQIARQWLLVNHRTPHDSVTGTSSLVMTTGGSMGHGDDYKVDVTEGKLNADFSGRTWDVTVSPYTPGVKKSKPKAEAADVTEDAPAPAVDATPKAAKPPKGQRLRDLLTDKGPMEYAKARSALSMSGTRFVKEIEALGDDLTQEGESPKVLSLANGKPASPPPTLTSMD
jgi:chemotaxis protein histidine kinase CheA